MLKLFLIEKFFVSLFFLLIANFINDKFNISGFVTKDAFAITAEEMLSDPILEKELEIFLLNFDVLFVKTNQSMNPTLSLLLI